MKNTPLDSYDKVLEALLDFGYTEEEAETIICDVIEDQRNFDDVQNRIHRIRCSKGLFGFK